VLNGRYGPYIAFNKSNYKIPKSKQPGELTLDDCRQLIAEADKENEGKPAKRNGKTTAKKSTAKKSTASKTSSKATPAKKKTAKGATAKKTTSKATAATKSAAGEASVKKMSAKRTSATTATTKKSKE
jgi:DNA topoisomerase-1